MNGVNTWLMSLTSKFLICQNPGKIDQVEDVDGFGFRQFDELLGGQIAEELLQAGVVDS